MTESTATHATFAIERRYAASPARVFEAFADPKVKAEWFNGPAEWGPDEHELDFRVGGTETSRGGPQGGPVHTFNAIYHDIVREQRIVYSYEMLMDGTRISVSLGTVELEPSEAGTLMLYTEQGAYLDGYDDAGQREHGTRELFDQLDAMLMRQQVGA
jgi:uncharacterized protein YndB with AHSA1/START domain